jgi:hypothetical protein
MTYASSLDEVKVEKATLRTRFRSPDGSARIEMEATLAEGKLDGTYEVHEAQSGSVLASGTWTAARSS